MPVQFVVEGLLLLFIYAVLLSPFLLLFNGETYVDMNVVGMETSLPVEFFSSPGKGRGDILFYHFELKPEKPLTLTEVVISNGKESRTFKHFEPDYNRLSFWGDPLNDSIKLLQEPSDNSQDFAKLHSRTRLLTSSTLEARYWREETENAITHFQEDDLNVLFMFEEGTVNVQYNFLDKEIRRVAKAG